MIMRLNNDYGNDEAKHNHFKFKILINITIINIINLITMSNSMIIIMNK